MTSSQAATKHDAHHHQHLQGCHYAASPWAPHTMPTGGRAAELARKRVTHLLRMRMAPGCPCGVPHSHERHHSPAPRAQYLSVAQNTLILLRPGMAVPLEFPAGSYMQLPHHWVLGRGFLSRPFPSRSCIGRAASGLPHTLERVKQQPGP